MASTLRSKAIKNLNVGNTSAYYSYVEEKNGTNPVIQQLEKELADFVGFVKKKNAGLLKPGEHPPCRVSDALFEIWNKFEPRVSTRFFNQKLMEVGEYLVQNREYSTASWQCYDRYLNQFTEFNFSAIQTVDDLKASFFSSTNPEQADNTDVTFRALMGHCICVFHFTIQQDPKLLNNNTISQLLETLRCLRLIMTLQLKTEHFCWLVYNATIYIYSIGRYMMQYGFSKNVLEHFLFCCLSMESSIPLMGIKYLSWRSTLYAATCQCYYDCKYNDDGETFARRALSKINELYELEQQSINAEFTIRSPQFREATIKIGTYLFKRLVYESRRKGKGSMRPKVRVNFKDIMNQQWPRTQTERLLVEMFDCSSGQFLAIEEALNDTNRRVAMPMPAANESEFENLDVVIELLLAAEFIAYGGCSSVATATTPAAIADNQTNFKSGDELDFKFLFNSNQSLISMAVNGENGVQLRNFLKVVKFAFNYEAWDIFRRLAFKMVNLIEASPHLLEEFQSELQTIQLLMAIDRYLITVRKQRQAKNDAIKANYNAVKEKALRMETATTTAKDRATVTRQETATTNARTVISGKESKAGKESVKSRNKKTRIEENITEIAESTSQKNSVHDEAAKDLKDEDFLLNVANRLMAIMDSETKPENVDLDIIVDTTLLLWRRCKEIFQKHQTGNEENYKWVFKLDNFAKWLFILNVVHESMCYFNISTIDPAVFAHCSLRLGLIYESLAFIETKKTKNSDTMTEAEEQFFKSSTTKLTTYNESNESLEKHSLPRDPLENLMKARQILSKALSSIGHARGATSKSDGTFLCDKNYDDTQNLEDSATDHPTTASTNPKKYLKLKNMKEKSFVYSHHASTNSVNNLVADLHVELIYLHHKICLRVLALNRDNNLLNIKTKQADKQFEKDFQILLNNCRRNGVSVSLLLLAKASYLAKNGQQEDSECKSLVAKAYQKLVQAEEEDKNLFYNHVKADSKSIIQAKVPPAPIVCLRTFNRIVVKPRRFEPSEGGKQVSWYRLFASQMTSVNNKARISDFSFPGCGEQIPSNSCDLVTISGLKQDEKYIFALAAYDNTGELIGNSIGESTEPVLASSSLSILMNWAFLCQASYQIGENELAASAFEKLWSHFIIKQVKPVTETCITRNEVDLELTFHQVNYTVIEKTSPLLIRKFLECFFINAEIRTRQKKIYCDVLFDGKVHYKRQLDRIRECERMIVAIELAAWLNDPLIILQAIVQCYGFLAPLIYYNIAYEPIVNILSHCMLVLEEVPTNVFQRKSKAQFESLQHMVACTTYYLTDILKRFNKRSMSNYLNLIGRKLLGLEELAVENTTEDEPGQDNPTISDQLTDNKRSTRKQFNELKALESYLAKQNASNKTSIFNMLTGNEDNTQIYAFIAQNLTKFSYKELVKFRKRPNFFELLINLLHKALAEELTTDINEWCLDTLNWLGKRNLTIAGANQIIVKKNDTFLGNHRRSLDGGGSDDENNAILAVIREGAKTKEISKKRIIKKYKLLIPTDLPMHEKIKLEEKQKAAIHTLYDLFLDRYEQWQRRVRLRRIFQEESAHKSQFYAVWALNCFSQLMTRINQSSPQNRMNYLHRLGTSSYLDPQQFLFDKNYALIIANESDQHDMLSLLTTNKKSNKKSVPLKKQTNTSKMSNLASNSRAQIKSNSNTSFEKVAEEKLHDLKDTAELIADYLTSIIEPFDDHHHTFSINSDSTSSEARQPQAPISSNDFADMALQVFNKFRRSVVIAHRYKQWTQLQNVCKLVFNCINTLVVFLPAISYNNRKLFRIQDVWKSVLPCVYLAAESLLDMIFVTTPIEARKDGAAKSNLVNKWYDAASIGRTGGGLRFDLPLDDVTSIDLRFVKDFIFRSVQCLAQFEKNEKLLSVALKFNALTGYKYAEHLSPVIINAQRKLLTQLELTGNKSQPHFDRLKAEIGRYPRIEDMFFLDFKVEIEPSRLAKKIDADLTLVQKKKKDDNRARELISVPLDLTETFKTFEESLGLSDYNSRALVHARRLLSLHLLSQSSHYEFYGVLIDLRHNLLPIKESELTNTINEDENTKTTDYEKEQQTYYGNNKNKQTIKLNEFFHVNPVDFKGCLFEDDNKVFIKEAHVDLKTVIESYEKAIKLLISHKEKDLAVQAMHELGNIYHFKRDIEAAYRYWNEALDTLLGVKNSVIHWRREFYNSETNTSFTDKILDKSGVWGCILGGVLTAKMAQYFLASDLELKTECCLFSAVLFKSILSASVSYSRHDLDYGKDDVDSMNSDFLLPGLLWNSDTHRFDIRSVVSSMNFICIELVNAGHYLSAMPAISLYEYFSRTNARDLSNTLFARLIKIEALIKLNMFKEAILLLNRVNRGERLPHYIDDRNVHVPSNPSYKYTEFVFDTSRPVFELNNLRCLENALSMKLSKFLAKLFGPHLTCRYHLVVAKLFVQVASCLPCQPDLKGFYASKLFSYTETNNANFADSHGLPKSGNTGINGKGKTNIDDNPDVVKVFSRVSGLLTLEFIKGCLIGTAKTLTLKGLRLFADDFPKVDKYVVSVNWQREYKYECNMLLANISDQCQLGYLALQNTIKAMEELSSETTYSVSSKKLLNVKSKPGIKQAESKQSKLVKKGVFQFFDLTSKAHLNSRLWLKARTGFIQFMFNQLNDAGKAKGNDDNIISDFADLVYYCERALAETDQYYDNEAKGFYYFIMASLDLIRGVSLQSCLDTLKKSLHSFQMCRQLSSEGLINYLKCQLLTKDISYSIGLLNSDAQSGPSLQKLIIRTLNELFEVEDVIFANLQTSGGETVERFIDRTKSYFNNLVENVRNLYNPLLFYLCQTKTRMGSCLILQSSLEENDQYTTNPKGSRKMILNALNVLSIGLELNKVISERSVNVEIEMSYKQAYCLKELYMKYKICTLNDVVDGFNYTIDLLFNSTHCLTLMKQCYLELAVTFISVLEPGIVYFSQFKEVVVKSIIIQKSTPLNKNSPQYKKAAESALTALEFAVKCSKAMKEKMLLPGHKAIKEMSSVYVTDGPIYVASDLLGYFVMADRRKIYRDEIEAEILSLAPEFDTAKQLNNKTYDEKVTALQAENNRSISWVHLLNYQSKLQHINSIRNLNTLKNGRNRNKFSDLYTIGLTPTFKNTSYMELRLSQLNTHMRQNLPVYKTECQGPTPIPEFFKAYSKSLSTFKQSILNARLVSEHVTFFKNNQASVLTNSSLFEDESNKQAASETNEVRHNSKAKLEPVEWSHLQNYPPNFNYQDASSIKLKEMNSSESVADYLITLNWYKSLSVSDKNSANDDDRLISVIATKEPVNGFKLKYKFLSAESVHEVHSTLSRLATIADSTMITKNSEGVEVESLKKTYAEFLVSLRKCLEQIASLFEVKFTEETDETGEVKFPFDLKSSNIIDLESMFNTKFGGYTHDSSLKNYLFSLFD